MHNLELDLYRDIEFCALVENDTILAQNLYAALCSVQWKKDSVDFHCSWRHAGSIVSIMQGGHGDYMDWYCSGIDEMEGIVKEGVVTQIIEKKLNNLGWKKVPYV